jgi:hypothetical protein
VLSGTNYLPFSKYLGETRLSADAWGRQKVYQDKSLFEAKWTYDVTNRIWEESSVTGGVRTPIPLTGTYVSSFENSLRVLSGTVAGTGNAVCSKRAPAYQANRGHLYSTAGWMPNANGDANRRWGLFINGNGVYFELEGTGSSWELYAVRKNNGAPVRQPLKALILAKIQDFNPEHNNTYDIQFQWRSAGNYFWYVNQQLIYEEENLGQLTTLSMRMPALPVNYECITNDGVEYEMRLGCVDVTSEGGIQPQRLSFALSAGGIPGSFLNVTTSTYGSATIAMRIPRTVSYGGGTVENTRALVGNRVSSWTRDESVIALWIARDIVATNLDALTWSTVPDSINEYLIGGSGSALDVAFQLDAPNMFKVAEEAEDIEIKDKIENPDAEASPYYFMPGDILVVSCKPVGPNKENMTTIYLSEEI